MEQYTPIAENPILSALRSLESPNFRIPLVVPSETKVFVRSLLSRCDTLFVDFMLRLSSSAVANQILECALPPPRLQLLLTILAEHERLAVEKEIAVAKQNFKLGAECRDGQYELIRKISELVPDPIAIAPHHVANALRSLGFDGELPG